MPRKSTKAPKSSGAPTTQTKLQDPVVIDESRHVNRRFMQTLPEKLNMEERADFGSKLAAAQRAVVAEKVRQFSAKKDLAAKLAEMESEVARLVEVVSNGERMRDIECEEIFDLKENRAFVIRTDDGHQLSRRTLTPAERQAKMPLKIAGKKPPKSDDAAVAPPAEG